MRRVPFAADEKTSLYVALDRHRDVVVWKLDGLDDEQLRRRVTPSGTSLLARRRHAGADRRHDGRPSLTEQGPRSAGRRPLPGVQVVTSIDPSPRGGRRPVRE